MGHLASQLLIVTQTVCILWWGRPLGILGQGDIRKPFIHVSSNSMVGKYIVFICMMVFWC